MDKISEIVEDGVSRALNFYHLSPLPSKTAEITEWICNRLGVAFNKSVFADKLALHEIAKMVANNPNLKNRSVAIKLTEKHEDPRLPIHQGIIRGIEKYSKLRAELKVAFQPSKKPHDDYF